LFESDNEKREKTRTVVEVERDESTPCSSVKHEIAKLEKQIASLRKEKQQLTKEEKGQTPNCSSTETKKHMCELTSPTNRHKNASTVQTCRAETPQEAGWDFEEVMFELRERNQQRESNKSKTKTVDTNYCIDSTAIVAQTAAQFGVCPKKLHERYQYAYYHQQQSVQVESPNSSVLQPVAQGQANRRHAAAKHPTYWRVKRSKERRSLSFEMK
jgi:hypothetical protein